MSDYDKLVKALERMKLALELLEGKEMSAEALRPLLGTCYTGVREAFPLARQLIEENERLLKLLGALMRKLDPFRAGRCVYCGVDIELPHRKSCAYARCSQALESRGA